MNTFFGADYYPEHWARERWETDARLMQEMGLDVVRLAEFSWSKLEPSEGSFNFGWLDEAIELLAGYGIKSILGTPTAAPPAWIISQTPDIQPIDSQNRQHFFGGRHHDCQSNPIYRSHIKRYVTAFAEHFGKNPNVIGWQIDNELGNSHDDLCFCQSCEGRFRQWLESKYKDIATLNQKWGTAFWSQEYQDFSQITAPKMTASGQNPSQLLDWKRFCSDLVVEFHSFQSEILRASAPDKFITHNMMGFADKVSYFDLAEDLDFASHDFYPSLRFLTTQFELRCDYIAAELDFIRGVKQKSFWIMEQQAGIPGWELLRRAPRPGELGMWAMQSVAHGADTVVFFRWRTCTVGTEQYWHGILPHSGIPGRNYDELKVFIQKVKPLMQEIQGTVPKPEVGILFSYEQEYAFKIQPHHPELTYVDHIMKYYSAFHRQNIPVDFVHVPDDMSKYKLIVAPLQYLMTAELENKFKDYVRNGGKLVLTMRTGVKDISNLCMSDKPLPGELSELVGLEVLEYDCLCDVTGQVSWGGCQYPCEKWSDIVKLTSAKALAAYSSEFYAGTPAITINEYGKGTAYYVGTEPSHELAARLVEEIKVTAQLRSFGDTPAGVEIVHRATDKIDYIFVINHTNEEKTVQIPAEWQAFYEGQSGLIPPFGFNVYCNEAIDTIS